MQTLARSLFAIGLVTAGYVLGATGLLVPVTLSAQEEQEGPSEETLGKVKAAAVAIDSAMAALSDQMAYKPAINGINSFAVTCGGVNAIQDLESGQGVDPETFAGLYAGFAIDEISEHLGKDEMGRLTYKNKLVRIYAISRLKAMFQGRCNFIGSE